MPHELIKWILFTAFILLMLVIDLGIFHRKTHEVKIKEALIWTAVWVSISLLFSLGVYFFMGHEKAIEFLTAYVIEESLSVDNMFVFILIFNYFNVPLKYQHTILFWGILGALVMRFIFIFSGIALIRKFHFIIYVFSAFLIYTGIRIFFEKEQKIKPYKNPIVKLFIKLFPVTKDFHETKFFLRIDNKIHITPLFIVLIFIEFTDLIFAVDSIPAILSISHHRFIVYTSNVFAILGLRSLYFALAGMHKYFSHLQYGISLILIFVGIKLGLSDIYKIPVLIALSIIVLILIVSILVSIVIENRKNKDNLTQEKK